MTPDIILQRTGIDVRAVEQGDVNATDGLPMRGLWLTTLVTLNEGGNSTANRLNRQSLL